MGSTGAADPPGPRPAPPSAAPAASGRTLATINAAFTAAQFAFGLVTGVLLTPMILAQIGSRTYSVWLTATEFLSYLALADLGVFSTIPWLLARAAGEGDHGRARRTLANAVAVGAVVGGLTLVGGALVWVADPARFGLQPADRDALLWPLTILTVSAGLACPTQVFTAALIGRQDFTFTGVLGLARAFVATALTVALVFAGYGLYGLGLAGIPVFLAGVASVGRAVSRHPDLCTGWPHPSPGGVAWLLRESFPGWMSGFGHRLVTASNGIILTAAGYPEYVAIYYCTAKAHMILQPITWMVPDSGLIRLAELAGEGDPGRTRTVVRQMIQLNLLLAGAAACGLWALNPLFVSRWVGPGLFGGHGLNHALTAGFLFAGLLHGVITSLAVTVRSRARLGAVLLAYGALSVAAAVGSVLLVGPTGVAWAPVLAAVPTCLVYGVVVLRRLHGLAPADLLGTVLGPWARASALPLAAAVAVGLADGWPAWATVAGTAGCCLAYLAAHRRTLDELPLPVGLRARLVRLRVVRPAVTPAVD